MSPTSYLTAPPRDAKLSIGPIRSRVNVASASCTALRVDRDISDLATKTADIHDNGH